MVVVVRVEAGRVAAARVAGRAAVAREVEARVAVEMEGGVMEVAAMAAAATEEVGTAAETAGEARAVVAPEAVVWAVAAKVQTCTGTRPSAHPYPCSMRRCHCGWW